MPRRLVPEFHVYLVRSVDGGHLLQRARINLVLSGILDDAREVSGLNEVVTREITIDLFVPPQRQRIRERASALAGQGLEQREIARELTEPCTQAAVYKALMLDRKMTDAGLLTPYSHRRTVDLYPARRANKRVAK